MVQRVEAILQALRDWMLKGKLPKKRLHTYNWAIFFVSKDVIVGWERQFRVRVELKVCPDDPSVTYLHFNLARVACTVRIT